MQLLLKEVVLHPSSTKHSVHSLDMGLTIANQCHPRRPTCSASTALWQFDFNLDSSSRKSTSSSTGSNSFIFCIIFGGHLHNILATFWLTLKEKHPTRFAQTPHTEVDLTKFTNNKEPIQCHDAKSSRRKSVTNSSHARCPQKLRNNKPNPSHFSYTALFD